MGGEGSDREVDAAVEPNLPAAPPRPDLEAERRRRRQRWVATIGVIAPPAIALAIPFFGLVVSFATPFMAGSVGSRVWPAPRRQIVAAGIVVFVGLWAAVIVGALTFGTADSLYLLIPLCGPAGALGFVVPPVAAAATYLLGSALSVWTRRVWIWPIAAVAGGLAYGVSWAAIEDQVRWVC